MRKFSQAVLAVFVLLLLIAQAQLVEDAEIMDTKITNYIGETGGR